MMRLKKQNPCLISKGSLEGHIWTSPVQTTYCSPLNVIDLIPQEKDWALLLVVPLDWTFSHSLTRTEQEIALKYPGNCKINL